MASQWRHSMMSRGSQCPINRRNGRYFIVKHDNVKKVMFYEACIYHANIYVHSKASHNICLCFTLYFTSIYTDGVYVCESYLVF